jgi:hypothetical protein
MRKTLAISFGMETLLENLNRVVVEESVAENATAPYDVQAELLFDVLWWWPYTRWPPPRSYGMPWSFSALLSSGKYQAQAEPEMAAGRRCVVLANPGRDAIYVDAAPPHCVFRRDIFIAETGALAWRCELGGHTNHGGNIWIPAWFTSQRFDCYATSKKDQKRLVVNTKFEISNVRVNDEITDEDFKIDFPPGTVRRKVANGFERLEAASNGQAEHANAMAEWARSVMSEKRPNTLAGHPLGLTARRAIAPLLLGIAMGLLLERAFGRAMQALLSRGAKCSLQRR